MAAYPGLRVLTGLGILRSLVGRELFALRIKEVLRNESF